MEPARSAAAQVIEERGGSHPALALAQGEDRVEIELALARRVIAALSDAAADLAEILATGGQYHATRSSGAESKSRH